jgi:hypothetical protein
LQIINFEKKESTTVTETYILSNKELTKVVEAATDGRNI